MTDEEMEKRTQMCRECPVHMIGLDLWGMINNWENCLFSTCPNRKKYQCHESENGKEDA